MRIAIVSDIHSNLMALEAVLADAGAVDEIWSPGDIVGYGPNPNECIDLLRQLKAVSVAGNHDWAAIGRLSTDDFNPDAANAANWTASRLTAENRCYLEELPLTEQRGEFTLVHGTLRHPVWEYLLSTEEAAATLALLKTRYCLVGHTHCPLVFLERGAEKSVAFFTPSPESPITLATERLILNPGSVGQPRDGIALASYLLLDRELSTAQIRRVPYHVERTQELMRSLNLPPRLWQRLSYGW